MNSRLKHLRRLVENSFPKIENFYEKVTVDFEKLENAKSFWSEIYVAKLTVNGGVEGVEIPETVFIKIPKISENVLKCEDDSSVDELHNVLIYYSKKENLFYNHFPYNSIPNFPFPKVYYTEEINGDSTGGIVAENLSDKVFAVEHIPGLSHEQILRLMDALAGFHAHLIQREDKSYVESFREGAHGRETYAEGMQKMTFDEALNLEKIAPEIFGNDRIQNIKWSFDYDNKNKATKEAIEAIPGIICHADLNVTNMLWLKNSPNSEIGAIIDFQMLLIGSVALDIVRILTLGLPKEIRRSKTNEYLQYYHNQLSAFFDVGKVPYSLSDLHAQYQLIYPFASNFTLFGIAVYLKLYKDGTLGKPENLESNCQELIERARGIVEDIEALKGDWK